MCQGHGRVSFNFLEVADLLIQVYRDCEYSMLLSSKHIRWNGFVAFS